MTPFEQLLSDAYATRHYLVELSPWDPATGGVVNLYYSDHGFTTEPGDALANQHFEARVKEALNFQRSLFQPGAIGGASIPDFGEILLDNADGGLDFFRTLAFDGRQVVVRLGGKGFAYADFGVVFAGTAQSAVVDEQQVTVRLRDLQYKLETPLQTAVYEGADPNVEGKPKPLCFGRCLNVAAVAVDPSQLLYQVHDGPVAAIEAVYDNGVLLNPPGDPSPQYTVNLAAGTFTLNQATVGQITADVRGDAAGGVYVETTADVVRRVVTTYGPLTESDLDTSTFDALNALNAGTIGLYVTEQRDVLDVLDVLINSIGGFYGFNRAGLFCVGRIEEPDRWPAVVLDGVDDRIAVAGLFYDGDAYAALTVEAWVLAEPPGGIIASWDRSEYWRFSVEPGGAISLRYRDSGNGVVQDLIGVASVLDGRWHHVAAALGGGQVALYIDGALDATFTVGPTFGQVGVVRYGFWGSGSEAIDESGTAHHAPYFTGRIAEGRVWDVARSQAEIAADMDRRLAGSEPGLVGYWRFDEGEGTTAGDATANLYHGTLAGATWNVAATFTGAEVLEIEAEATELPLWRQRVSYQRNWTVQNADSLGGSVSEDRRAFVTKETRLAMAEDPAVKGRHLLARDPEPIAALFDAQSAADAEAQRLLALYSVRRYMYRVTVKTQPYRLDLNDQVQLVYPRFGLDQGRAFRVIGLEERAEVNRVTLELWG